MTTESNATPERLLYEAAHRTLGNTSDEFWAGKEVNLKADHLLLARHYLEQREREVDTIKEWLSEARSSWMCADEGSRGELYYFGKVEAYERVLLLLGVEPEDDPTDSTRLPPFQVVSTIELWNGSCVRYDQHEQKWALIPF